MNKSYSRRQPLAALVGVAGVCLLAGQASWAAEATVPPGVQAALTLRILEYDRALKSWAGTSLTVGVVARNPNSADVGEFRQAISGRDVQGLPLKTSELAYKDAESLQRWLDRSGAKLLYLAPDLGNDAGAIIASAVSRRSVTLALSREQFQMKSALGLVVKDGKPHILVNLAASRYAGMDLDPKLLQLSEVVR